MDFFPKTKNIFHIRRLSFSPPENLVKQSPSSLLIPEEILEEFSRRAKGKGGIKAYIRFLLRNFSFLIQSGLLENPSKVKRRFQAPGQNLFKVSFRPHLEDWAEIKTLADLFSVSCCFLVCVMILADIEGFSEKLETFRNAGVGIPQASDFSFTVSLHFSRPGLQFRKRLRFH